MPEAEGPQRASGAWPAVRLRSMTAGEFQGFRESASEEYAASQVDSGRWLPSDALQRALRETDRLLPQGTGTRGTLLMVAEDELGRPVGEVWVGLQAPGGSGAWIYQINVSAERRRQGYGRATLAAVEELARGRGVGTIGLNVFGDNDVARKLYVSAGYEVAALHMQKRL